jgi:hypothetical protein
VPVPSPKSQLYEVEPFVIDMSVKEADNPIEEAMKKAVGGGQAPEVFKLIASISNSLPGRGSGEELIILSNHGEALEDAIITNVSGVLEV